MANFEESHRKFMTTQGKDISQTKESVFKKIVLCSECFKDEGLKINSYLIGIESKKKCPNCGSKIGFKLTKHLVQKLCYLFFVRGTIAKMEYGGFPLVQFNEHHFKNSNIDLSEWIVEDVNLIENIGELCLFYYGPRFWMFGEIEPLKLLKIDSERDSVVNEILKLYPSKKLTQAESFYRVRISPDKSDNINEFDTAPQEFLGKNRFDDVDFPVLYGSSDLELCMHECRVTAEDDIFVGKLVPTRVLNLLDLSALIEDEKTEFESLDMALHFLFLAGSHSYGICRFIARRAKEAGYDGIVYPSYFSYVKTGAIPFDTVSGISIRKLKPLKDYAQSQIIPNLILFGRPVEEKLVTVECINKVVINRIQYDLTFGPAKHTAFEEEKYLEDKNKKYEAAIFSALKNKAIKENN